jgi:NADH-quinone oxidoreductase subunit E
MIIQKINREKENKSGNTVPYSEGVGAGEYLTDLERNEIDHELAQVPYKSAAVIEALKIVQRHRRWISDDSVNAIAAYLQMSPAEVDSVATFYNLIFRKPVGRHVILVCDSISCYVMKYGDIYKALQEKLHIRFGETTGDQCFTLLPNACLGCCDHAPALMIDNDLYKDVTVDMLDRLLQKYT